MDFTLRRGPLRAQVTDAGGELVGLWDGAGTPYIWPGDPASWAGRNPNLFPIVGGLREGTVSFAGRPFHMKRHGFARNKTFTPLAVEEDAVELLLTQDPDTLAQYPFPFRLLVRHRLLEDGFSTTLSVTNPGDAPLPYCVGGHTAFRCPLRPGEAFGDYRLVFDKVEDALSPRLTPRGTILSHSAVKLLDHTDTLELDLDRFRELDTLIFSGLRSAGVSLVHRETGRGVRLDFSEFPLVAFWTVPGAPFLCLEPWHGCAALEEESGEFTDKPHCITLRPGEERSLTYRVTLL